MTVISNLGPAGPILPAGRARTAAGIFRMPEEARATTVEAAVLPGTVGLPSLLALQEAEVEAAQDREARRHSRTMLDMLTQLQRALLGGGGRDDLEALARLVRAAPPPSHPALAAVQRAVLVRAAVELARGRRDDDRSHPAAGV